MGRRSPSYREPSAGLPVGLWIIHKADGCSELCSRHGTWSSVVDCGREWLMWHALWIVATIKVSNLTDCRHPLPSIQAFSDLFRLRTCTLHISLNRNTSFLPIVHPMVQNKGCGPLSKEVTHPCNRAQSVLFNKQRCIYCVVSWSWMCISLMGTRANVGGVGARNIFDTGEPRCLVGRPTAWYYHGFGVRCRCGSRLFCLRFVLVFLHFLTRIPRYYVKLRRDLLLLLPSQGPNSLKNRSNFGRHVVIIVDSIVKH